jgi:hypothetical protein
MAVQSSISPELFKDLVEIDVNGYCVDLHNDYDCLKLRFSDAELLMSFKSIRANSKYSFVVLQFKAVEIKKLHINFGVDAKHKTIDRLHRCRFLHNGQLIEYSNEGKAFYVLEFCEGYAVEFFTAELVLILE